jgi:Uma2 family endonuclease
MPMRLSRSTELEPDIAVMKGDIRQQLGKGHVFKPLLVIEVAESTLSFDRDVKAGLYASAAVADYWIVNLVDHQLEVHRKPSGGQYGDVQLLSAAQRISPLAAPGVVIPVSDLLP